MSYKREAFCCESLKDWFKLYFASDDIGVYLEKDNEYHPINYCLFCGEHI